MSAGLGDRQASFCAALVDEWVRSGVTDAVVAPGSRSTPLVVAVAASSLRTHVVLDERSAGFLALGIGLASGRPALVITTSGTAAVELHPAVVEASQACVPLLAITADRPPELHDVGAPQTVEQVGLYGSAPRWALSVDVAGLAATSWRSIGARSVAAAVAGPAGPGPVHLNMMFGEPLLGSPTEVPPGRADGVPWHVVSRPAGGAPVPASVASVASLLERHAGGRGLVVAGGGGGVPPAILAAARQAGWPVFADPRSGCRLPGGGVVAAADALLRVPAVAAWRPDLVLRVGAPWASKVVGQWLAGLGSSTTQVLVDPWGRWLDPDRVADVVVADDVVPALLGAPSHSGSAWAAQWERAEAAAQSAISSALGCAESLSEPAVARAVVAGVPDGGSLVVASSMPVRDVEWYGAPRDGVVVYANRGANGIDGVLSTAVGVAAGSGAPTVALVGDLAFQYDAGALLGATGRGLALTVVVVDNDGGGIFSFLPQAAALPADVFERYWGTPFGVDVGGVAAAYGAEVVPVGDRAALDSLLARSSSPGVRVGVVRTSREANVADHDAVHAAVAAAVAALLGEG